MYVGNTGRLSSTASITIIVLGILLFFSLLTIVGLSIIILFLKQKIKEMRTSGPGDCSTVNDQQAASRGEIPPTLSGISHLRIIIIYVTRQLSAVVNTMRLWVAVISGLSV